MINVLIAEDELIMLNLLEKEFIDAGFCVSVAKNGSEASILCSKNKFDVIILDINMPYKSGIEVLKEIRLFSKESVVIMITAFASIQSAIESIKLGADDYVTKPYDIDDLLNKISQNIKHRNLKTKNKNVVDDSPTYFSEDYVAILQIENIINKIKDLNITVLITGQSGTGKGFVAKKVHYSSIRKDLPFVHVDCASLPENLIESELFGYEKGAFTGAMVSKKGKFELAQGGTIFLDEIGALPLNLQAKLLTAIQEKSIDRLGGTSRIPFDARIIAATNENLEDNVENKTFRQDLYYRLNVVRLELPPLKYRKDDIIKLSKIFINRFIRDMNKNILEIEDRFWEAIKCYEWPGNVRELENVIESSIALCDTNILTLEDLPLRISKNGFNKKKSFEDSIKITLKEQEFLAIMAALEKFDGHREKTAQYLGISRRALQYKLKNYNIN